MIVALGLFLFAFLVVRPVTDILQGQQQNDAARLEKGKKALMRNGIIFAVIFIIGLALILIERHEK